MTVTKNSLRDGWTLIVKRECATCVMVVPVITRLVRELPSLTVYTQDDPTFPEGVAAVNDLDLAATSGDAEIVLDRSARRDPCAVRRIPAAARRNVQCTRPAPVRLG